MGLLIQKERNKKIILLLLFNIQRIQIKSNYFSFFQQLFKEQMSKFMVSKDYNNLCYHTGGSQQSFNNLKLSKNLCIIQFKFLSSIFVIILVEAMLYQNLFKQTYYQQQLKQRPVKFKARSPQNIIQPQQKQKLTKVDGLITFQNFEEEEQNDIILFDLSHSKSKRIHATTKNKKKEEQIEQVNPETNQQKEAAEKPVRLLFDFGSEEHYQKVGKIQLQDFDKFFQNLRFECRNTSFIITSEEKEVIKIKKFMESRFSFYLDNLSIFQNKEKSFILVHLNTRLYINIEKFRQNSKDQYLIMHMNKIDNNTCQNLIKMLGNPIFSDGCIEDKHYHYLNFIKQEESSEQSFKIIEITYAGLKTLQQTLILEQIADFQLYQQKIKDKREQIIYQGEAIIKLEKQKSICNTFFNDQRQVRIIVLRQDLEFEQILQYYKKNYKGNYYGWISLENRYNFCAYDLEERFADRQKEYQLVDMYDGQVLL
ncbi:hypothetical protein pb186bvf_002544 [Paramecium bursaria]